MAIQEIPVYFFTGFMDSGKTSLIQETLFENNEFIFHCANTSAALKYPEMKLNAVRVGSGIQGRVLKEFQDLGLKKIGYLETEITNIKTLPKGYNVSYSNEFVTKKETKYGIMQISSYERLTDEASIEMTISNFEKALKNSKLKENEKIDKLLTNYKQEEKEHILLIYKTIVEFSKK